MLDTQTKEHLLRRTEGWAAVLQLAAADIARGESPRKTFAHLAAPHSNLFQYLSDEVLIHLRPQQHEFLLQTAFVNELSGPLCDAITGRADGETMLLELQQSNLLLQPIDSSRRRYRYHALFADFLRQQLRERHPEQLPTLARRASDWCARWDTPENAVEYALLAADPDHLIACIGSCMEQLITRAQFGTAKRWLRAIPPNALQARPELLIWTAWVEVYTNNFTAAETAIANLAVLSSGRRLALNERLGESVLKVLLLILHGRYDEALTTTESAWRQSPPVDRRFIAALCNLRGLMRLMRGRFAEATQDSERVLAIASQSPPIWLSLVHAAHISAMTEMSLGNLSGALRQLELPERTLTLSEIHAQGGGNPSQLLALLSGPKALVLYELNQCDDAEDCLERYEPFLNTMFSPSSRTLWHQLRARLRALRGDEDGYLSAIQQGGAYATRHAIAWMEIIMKWERVDHELARGDIDRARALASDLLQSARLGVAPDWIIPCEEIFGPIISAIRFLIHGGESRRALEYLPIQIAHSERQLRRLRLIKLRLLEALAREALGERQQAIDALRKAVDLGRPCGAIRCFVDEGAVCLALLREFARQGELHAATAAYLARLRAAFEDAEDLGNGAVETKHAASSPVALSSPGNADTPASGRRSFESGRGSTALSFAEHGQMALEPDLREARGAKSHSGGSCSEAIPSDESPIIASTPVFPSFRVVSNCDRPPKVRSPSTGPGGSVIQGPLPMLSKDAAGHWNAGANAAAGLPAAAQAAELVRLAARLLRLKSRLKFGDVGLGQARAAHVPAATLNATGHGARQASARNEFDALQEFAVVLISEIQQAIDRDAFCYFYQPIVGASSGIVEGYEALMRWRRGAQTVAPALFLPIAEETGSLGTMQQRLLDDVAKAWVQLAPPAFVSINWSPRQFLKASAASALIDRVKELKIDPKRIVIEITARSTVIDPDLVYFCIVLLKETGFQIALDDFGGNYGSSLLSEQTTHRSHQIGRLIDSRSRTVRARSRDTGRCG